MPVTINNGDAFQLSLTDKIVVVLDTNTGFPNSYRVKVWEQGSPSYESYYWTSFLGTMVGSGLAQKIN